jgi:hypothetical protein
MSEWPQGSLDGLTRRDLLRVAHGAEPLVPSLTPTQAREAIPPDQDLGAEPDYEFGDGEVLP